MREKIVLPHFVIRLEKGSRDVFELRIIVTRKIKRAVDRNRIKRIVREFFWQKRGLLPGRRVVCRIVPEAVKSRNAALFQELAHGLGHKIL